MFDEVIRVFKRLIPPYIKRAIRNLMSRFPLPLGIKLRFSISLSTAEKQGMIQRLMNQHRASKKRKTILFWRGPSRGSIQVEVMIALALKLRGYDVQFVLCDGALSGCIQRGFNKESLENWHKQCPNCVQFGADEIKSLGLSYVGISDFVSSQKRKELRNVCDSVPDNELDSFEYKGVPVGLFAKTAVERYLRGHGYKDHKKIFIEYLYSALVCTDASISALNQLKPSRIFMQQHDFYPEWAPALRIAHKAGLPIVFWGGGVYDDGGIGFRHAKDTQFKNLHSISDKFWHQRSARSLIKSEDKALNNYIDDMYSKRQTHGVQKSDKYNSKEKLLNALDIQNNKPVWCIFAHVTWGEAANMEPGIYDDTVSWIINTVRIISEVKNVNWLIKAHPAERENTKKDVISVIQKNFPKLKENIKFISAKSDISLQDLLPILSGGVTISGSPGLELAIRGIPSILTGQAQYYERKGFTYDPSNQEEYAKLLNKANRIGPLSQNQVKLARQYTYSHYFQRRIPMNMSVSSSRFAPLDFHKLDLLLPGGDKAMDMICDRIIDGGEFIL